MSGPIAAAGAAGAAAGAAGAALNEDAPDGASTDLLLARAVPPSHILPDGRFIRLPPPSAADQSGFFERAVASRRLISVDGGEDRRAKAGEKRRRSDDGGGDASDAEGKGKRTKAEGKPSVHPLAVASARLRAEGADELSKAMNLGGLVLGGEYFGLTNVVDAGAGQPEGANGKAKEGDNGKSDEGVAGVTDESALLDGRLRSRHVLRRRRSQNAHASTVLARHLRRLSSSVCAARVVDNRLRGLRGRWRLVPPEHGTREGPVRPSEAVAVDVEVYDRRVRQGGIGAEDGIGTSLGRIARRVPRFATVELDDSYDVSADAKSLRKQIKSALEGMKRVDDMDEDGDGSTEMDVDKPEPSNLEQQSSTCITKAEPFAIADPTLGKIDPDFDPDKVPLLTLLFEIEKPTTGFVARASLSTSFAKDGTSENGGRHMAPDERVIEALQHSLFCASLFESMRTEIIPASTNSAGGVTRQQQKAPAAWLSSETEESFLPPPSVTSGGLCVIHCHEGEVKVQLDGEYSLTVKLIEAGTASAAAATNSDGTEDLKKAQQAESGSQGAARLQALCRALLLQSQSLYHEHCTKREKDAAVAKKEEKPALGFARRKEEKKAPSPHILQSCVGLGCKYILERKVRATLKSLSRWLEDVMGSQDTIDVEWLPLSLFDSHSLLALTFREICVDININGVGLEVTQIGGQGEFKSVSFGSATELQCFLKLELRRALAES